MEYRVEYKLLNNMYEQLNTQAASWKEKLTATKNALSTLSTTWEMSGRGADAIRAYLKEIQIPLVDGLLELVELHRSNFVLYKNHYQSYIDTDFDVVIDGIELNEIKKNLDKMKQSVIDIDDEVGVILHDVQDIIYICRNSVESVAGVIAKVSNRCKKLDEDIIKVENTYIKSAFVNTEAAIEILAEEINVYLEKERDFKANYDPNSSESINTKKNLSMINSVLVTDINGKEEAVNAAMDNHESRKETEKRITAGKWQKLIVTAAVVVASTVIVAAIPVSGPLVVGLASAATSATLGAAHKAIDLYVEDGDISGEDLREIAFEGGKGAVIGFVTGVVGGATSKVLTDITKGIPAIQGANAANTVARVTIGSTTKITSGIIERGTGEVINQIIDYDEGLNLDIDLKQVGEKAFDVVEMAKDGISAGVEQSIEKNKMDYSTGMNSEYEKRILKEMHESGELSHEVYSDIDTVDIKNDSFFNKATDFMLEHKEIDRELNIKTILSSGEYLDKESTNIDITKTVTEKIISTLDKGGGEDFFKSNDEILREIKKD